MTALAEAAPAVVSEAELAEHLQALREVGEWGVREGAARAMGYRVSEGAEPVITGWVAPYEPTRSDKREDNRYHVAVFESGTVEEVCAPTQGQRDPETNRLYSRSAYYATVSPNAQPLIVTAANAEEAQAMLLAILEHDDNDDPHSNERHADEDYMADALEHVVEGMPAAVQLAQTERAEKEQARVEARHRVVAAGGRAGHLALVGAGLREAPAAPGSTDGDPEQPAPGSQAD